ncbi:MAG: hypothetical protein ABWZ99_08150 [Ilumatobacteraceae bacterium]
MPIDDAPRVGGNKNFVDELTITAVHRYPDVSGDERLYRTLMDALAAMTGGGPDADENYQRTIRELGADDEFVGVVLKTLDALEEDEYQERWALVQLAIDLENRAAGDYLVEFVRREIAPERSKDPVHGVSTVTEEVILRTTAIEGLARLFRHDYDASDALLEIVSSAEYTALRRASWFALIDGGRDDAVERAREVLRDSDYAWIADLKRIPVQEAEQHDPERIHPPTRGDIPPPFNE